MTREEFNDIKFGDKIRIISELPDGYEQHKKDIKKWLGKVMTVVDVSYHYVRTKEDNATIHWFPKMIERKLSDEEIVKLENKQ